MSDEETQMAIEDGPLLTAEYKDGQLQIVEVSAFDKGRYVQVLDKDQGVMNLDLLSLIKSDGNTTFQLVESVEDTGEDGETVTCVLTQQDSDDADNQDSYVIVNSEEEGRDPLVYLQSTLQQINTQQAYREDTKKKKPLTPEQILEKAKAIQKANSVRVKGKPGRKRKSSLPPLELLNLVSTPGFKLYLYSCKQCSFKCNAIKEMSKHKATEHTGRGRGGGAGRSASATLQCARCPYRTSLHTKLVKHNNEVHFSKSDNSIDGNCEVILESGDVCDADVLVCGACGFESPDRPLFRQHIESAHGLNVSLSPGLISLDDEESLDKN